MNWIIMLRGYPLSGKSFLAEKIKAYFDEKKEPIAIIKSVVTRFERKKKVKFINESIDETVEKTKKEKDESYRLLCEYAKKHLLENKIVILDATFHKRYRREWVYRLAKETNSKLLILWVVFNNSAQIKKYLEERRVNPDFKDKVLHTWKQYKIMVSQTDGLEENEARSFKIIKFDRGKNKVKFYNCTKNEDFVSDIYKLIKMR